MLPHAYPFLLLDREPAGDRVVVRWTAGGGLARGAAEAPAFLAVEMMAQSTLVALAGDGGAQPVRGGLLAGIEEVRLHGPILAGDELVAEAAVVGRFGRLLKAHTRLVRAGRVVAEGTLLLALDG